MKNETAHPISRWYGLRVNKARRKNSRKEVSFMHVRK